MPKLLRLFSFLILITFMSCNSSPSTLKPGMWRATVNTQGEILPFNFELKRSERGYEMIIYNAEERLTIDNITITGDSVTIPMHIFDADIKAVLVGDKLLGYWKKNYEENYKLSFKAEPGIAYRFENAESTNDNDDFNGKWDVSFFYEENGKIDTTQAIGIFKSLQKNVKGTFLTPTGDYRYLEGSVINDTLKLSTFDGGHAFLFKAVFKNDTTLTGQFWSGYEWYETWTAVRNDEASLPNADSLTYLKQGFDKLTFAFPDLNGDTITNEEYLGEPLVLQIFGTWCPNCMDETKFLTQWYKDNKHRGVKILGLAYEAKLDFDYAQKRVRTMKDKYDVQYDFAIAGSKDKEEASKTLPMLNHIISFPTTIFIDKNGDVKRIHTGFTGPGTGPYYEQFIKDFNRSVDELLEE